MELVCTSKSQSNAGLSGFSRTTQALHSMICGTVEPLAHDVFCEGNHIRELPLSHFVGEHYFVRRICVPGRTE